MRIGVASGVYGARRSRPILDEVERAGAGFGLPETGNKGGETPASLATLVALPAEERAEKIRTWIEGEVRAVLRLGEGRDIDPDEGFFEMGMDSLMSVELKTRLERRFEVALPATLTFNYPTVSALGRFIEALLPSEVGEAETGSGVAQKTEETPKSGRLGDGDDLSEAALSDLLEERLRRLDGGGA